MNSLPRHQEHLLTILTEVQNPRKQTLAKTFPDVFDMNSLSEKLEKLSSFKANVLRTKTLGEIDWEKVDAKWKGGVKVSPPHVYVYHGHILTSYRKVRGCRRERCRHRSHCNAILRFCL